MKPIFPIGLAFLALQLSAFPSAAQTRTNEAAFTPENPPELLPLTSHVNGQLLGAPEAGVDMTFDFPALIAHCARTRNMGAGTIVGSGTVSNLERVRGSSCLAEKRMLEQIATGQPVTPFLKFGDRVRIEMLDRAGATIFGAIDQRVARV